MCDYCCSYWTTCEECGKGLCKECATPVYDGQLYIDMCPGCAADRWRKEDEEDD